LESPSPTFQTGYVLVVDDEWKNRMLLRDILEVQGHDVDEAEDGEEALRKVAERCPDAVLLDVMMPRLDGFEVCRRLKSDPDTAVVPVILVTALSERSDRLKGMQAGANDFLAKPIDTQETLLRVRNAVHARRLYEQLQQGYRRLQELEALRHSLTGMIVHDMRTPLTALLGGLETMGALGDLNDDQQEFLNMSIQGGLILVGMINDLLDISKMEAGELALEREEVRADALAAQALAQVRQLGEDRSLEIRLEISPELPAFSADGEKLRRTLVNLLGNAIKFTPEGGSVVLSARPGDTDGELLFSVSDTGEGIPKEAFERIFEKFGQVANRKAGRRTSTGLGLTFCKMAVEAHGGRIWVESTLGEGSTFHFTLPVG